MDWAKLLNDPQDRHVTVYAYADWLTEEGDNPPVIAWLRTVAHTLRPGRIKTDLVESFYKDDPNVNTIFHDPGSIDAIKHIWGNGNPIWASSRLGPMDSDPYSCRHQFQDHLRQVTGYCEIGTPGLFRVLARSANRGNTIGELIIYQTELDAWEDLVRVINNTTIGVLAPYVR